MGPATPLPEPIDPVGIPESSVTPITPAYTPVERDEIAILHDATAGEPVAVRILLDVHMPTVYGFVFARVGGRTKVADEITQETLEQAVRSSPTFRGESSLATWLCTIARKKLARYYDHERRREDSPRASSSVDDAGDETSSSGRRDEVVRALGTLLASQRQALVLTYLDHLSVEQVATEMGITLVQVQTMLQRGRDALMKELDRVG